MYLFTIVATPTEANPDHSTIGAAYVSCWIDIANEEEAKNTARRLVADDGWAITGIEETRKVFADDFQEDDENLQYFEQALLDKTVLVFNTSPRFSVCKLIFQISGGDESISEAWVWLANGFVDPDHDSYDLDFWSGKRLERAVGLATDALAESGFSVVRLIDHVPCEFDDASDEAKYFDEAETYGSCIVLVHE